jgi:hypothetical protein
MYSKRRASRPWLWRIFSSSAAAALIIFAVLPLQSNAELGGNLFRVDNEPVSWDKSAKMAVGLSVISSQPHAHWLGAWGNDQNTAASIVASALLHNQIPEFVLYNIPYRDCGQASEGGATDYNQYSAWVHAVAQGIADGVNQANAVSRNRVDPNIPIVVMLEPDSIGLIPTDDPNDPTNASKCWGHGATGDFRLFDPQERFNALVQAVWTLSTANYGAPVCNKKKHSDGTLYTPVHCPSFESRVKVYLDGGNSGWQSGWVNVMAQRMVAAGIGGAQGFFTNSSNYQTTRNEIGFGYSLTNAIGSLLAYTQLICGDDGEICNIPTKTQIIDVSRNGNGPGNFSKTADGSPYQPNGWPYWCDDQQARLGQHPTLYANNYVADVSPKGPVSFIDGLLWIKAPGETDGCWGGPTTAPNVQPSPSDILNDSADGTFGKLYSNAAGWPSPSDACGLVTGTWVHPAYSAQSTAMCNFLTTDVPVYPRNFRITNITRKVDGAKADTVRLEWEPSPGACEYRIAARLNSQSGAPSESIVHTVVYANGTPVTGQNRLVFSGNPPPTAYVVNPAVHAKSVRYEILALSCNGTNAGRWTYGSNNRTVTTAFP